MSVSIPLTTPRRGSDQGAPQTRRRALTPPSQVRKESNIKFRRKSADLSLRKDGINGEQQMRSWISEALKLFNKIDKDQKGAVPLEGLIEGIKSVAPDIDEESIRGIYEAEGAGLITKSRFIEGLHKFYPSNLEEEEEAEEEDSGLDHEHEEPDDREAAAPRGRRLTLTRRWAAKSVYSGMTKPGGGEEPKLLALTLFQLLDIDDNGALNFEPFRDFMLQMDPSFTPQGLEAIFKAMDRLNTGVITESDFVAGFRHLSSDNQAHITKAIEKRSSITDKLPGAPPQALTSPRGAPTLQVPVVKHPSESTTKSPPASPRRRQGEDTQTYENAVTFEELESQLEGKTHEVQTLERELHSTKALAERLTKRFQTVVREHDSATSENEALRGASAQLKKDLARSQVQAQTYRESTLQLQQLCDSLQKRLTKLEEQLKTAKSGEETIRYRLNLKQSVLGSTLEELMKLQNGSAHDKTATKQKELTKLLQQQIAQLARALEEREEELKDATSKRDKALGENAQLRADKEYAERLLANLRTQLTEMQQAVRETNPDLAQELMKSIERSTISMRISISEEPDAAPRVVVHTSESAAAAVTQAASPQKQEVGPVPEPVAAMAAMVTAKRGSTSGLMEPEEALMDGDANGNGGKITRSSVTGGPTLPPNNCCCGCCYLRWETAACCSCSCMQACCRSSCSIL